MMANKVLVDRNRTDVQTKNQFALSDRMINLDYVFYLTNVCRTESTAIASA